jgi:integrase
MNNAVKKGIINSNIASYVQNPIPDTKREFLTVEELEKLSKNGYHIKEIQNAFLFSCFTGFRISDIKNLTWRNIKKDYIEIKQKKTEDNIRVKLSDSAKKILKYQLPVNHKSDKIFTLPKENAINKHINLWMQQNNIDKHITFHCARHTFATLCLTYDIDIYTLSKLLGHKDIKNTQIYAKLIDKKKDEAIDKLPVF